MGLFSKFKQSNKDKSNSQEPNTALSADTSLPVSVPAPERKPSSESMNEEISKPKPQPDLGKDERDNKWLIHPHAGDYEARIHKLEADREAKDADGKPHKKNWLKDKLDLAGPDDPEYYERRYTASGNGSNYEQGNTLALISGGQ